MLFYTVTHGYYKPFNEPNNRLVIYFNDPSKKHYNYLHKLNCNIYEQSNLYTLIQVAMRFY